MRNLGSMSRLNAGHEDYELRHETVLRVRGIQDRIVSNPKEGIYLAKNERRGAKVITRDLESWTVNGKPFETYSNQEEIFNNGR